MDEARERATARPVAEQEEFRLEAVFASASAALAIVRGLEAIYEKTNASYENLLSIGRFWASRCWRRCRS